MSKLCKGKSKTKSSECHCTNCAEGLALQCFLVHIEVEGIGAISLFHHLTKLTTGGDLVHEMDSIHKKPYEAVVIGRYEESSSHSCDSTPPPKRTRVASCDETYSAFEGDQFTEPENCAQNKSPPSDTNTCTKKTFMKENSNHEWSVQPEISEHFTFACVASQTHSQKPYLGGILYV